MLLFAEFRRCVTRNADVNASNLLRFSSLVPFCTCAAVDNLRSLLILAVYQYQVPGNYYLPGTSSLVPGTEVRIFPLPPLLKRVRVRFLGGGGPIAEYATDVENLLFLARLEFLRKPGCVPHYFLYKEVTFSFPPPKSQTQILNYQILDICRVLHIGSCATAVGARC